VPTFIFAIFIVDDSLKNCLTGIAHLIDAAGRYRIVDTGRHRPARGRIDMRHADLNDRWKPKL
jgi:hypothetical protein